MSTRATSNNPTNVVVVQAKGGHANDQFSKATSASVFPVVAVSGNVIEIWSDGAIWDTVANKFLTTNDIKRTG